MTLLLCLQAIRKLQQDLVDYKRQIQRVIGSGFTDYITVSGEKVLSRNASITGCIPSLPCHVTWHSPSLPCHVTWLSPSLVM